MCYARKCLHLIAIYFLSLSGFLSVVLHQNEDKHQKYSLSSNISRVMLLVGKNLNLLVLVVIYAYTNTMQYKAVMLIGAPTYAVVMQSKIFFTAGFGVLFLARRYTFTKWRALLLLVIGCILVSSPILVPKVVPVPCDALLLQQSTSEFGSLGGSNVTSVVPITKRFLRGQDITDHMIPYSSGSEASLMWSSARNLLGESSSTESDEVTALSKSFGLAITLSIAICSGFSSVYFEKILKNGPGEASSMHSSPTAIWDRNFQLAFYSIIFTSSLSVYQYATDSSDSFEKYVMFSGWSWVTFLICIVNSLGGFLVAATLKYADAIMKCFATAVAIIVTSIIGYFFLDSEITMFSSLGMLTTILSVLNYTLVEK